MVLAHVAETEPGVGAASEPAPPDASFESAPSASSTVLFTNK
jgi:hypothetical protein